MKATLELEAPDCCEHCHFWRYDVGLFGCMFASPKTMDECKQIKGSGWHPRESRAPFCPLVIGDDKRAKEVKSAMQEVTP